MPALPSGVQVLERGWLSSNNVLLLGQDQCALVDSGYHTHSAQTLALVAAALAGRPLDLLVNTHLHSDHCGGNAALQAHYPSLRTLIPPGQAAAVRGWDETALSYRSTGQQCLRFGFDDVLQPGQDLRLGDTQWQVHAAPGHDPHSVILFEPVSAVLISADALWETGFGVVFPELDGVHAFDEVAQTLDLIEQLAPRTVIPGHGPVFHTVGTALGVARRRLESFVREPRKHAVHAAKVLLKFKLLELHRVQLGEFVTWANQTGLMHHAHQTHFGDQPLPVWLGQLAQDLVRSGAAAMDGDWLVNA